MRGLKQLRWSGLLVVLMLGSALAGCGSAASAPGPQLAMAAHDHLSPLIQAMPERVRNAYQLAAANPEVFKEIPCYCGCDKLGHKNNYDCYIDEVQADGTFVFDAHAVGCQICVDITHDATQMLNAGQSLPEVQVAIDTAYARYGPPTVND